MSTLRRENQPGGIRNKIDEMLKRMGISFVDQRIQDAIPITFARGSPERVNLSLPNHYAQTFKRQYPLVFDTAVS